MKRPAGREQNRRRSKRVPAAVLALLLPVLLAAAPARAAKLGPSLAAKLSGLTNGARGYVQIALHRGILDATFSSTPQPALTASPAGSVTRSDLAFAIDHYRQGFAIGN